MKDLWLIINCGKKKFDAEEVAHEQHLDTSYMTIRIWKKKSQNI